MSFDEEAGFRNMAIHDYQAIDKDILKSILAKALRILKASTRQYLFISDLSSSRAVHIE